MADYDNKDTDLEKEIAEEGQIEAVREEEDSKEAERGEDSEKKEPKEPKKEYEDVCFICRRPESKTGKMFKLPNNITVCNDCMHKTMDTVSQFDYQGLLNNPSFGQDMGKGFPNISFVKDRKSVV